MNLARAARSARLRLIIITAVLAVATVVAVAAQAASAHASSSHVLGWGGGPKPTIVLEHGARADASSWDKVILQLQEDGFTVYALPNPLRGVSYDSTYLTDFLSAIPGPIVLVGHSYGRSRECSSCRFPSYGGPCRYSRTRPTSTRPCR
jgi:Alpha/beta hydrolase family